MSCTICGKATSRGALLCKPCKAALKRARQLTVQDMPQRSARARGKGARRDALAEPSTGIDALRRPMRRDRAAGLLLAVATIAALAGAAYVAARGFAGHAVIPAAPPALVAQPRAPDPIPVVSTGASDALSAPLPAPPMLPELTSSPPLRPPVGAPLRTAAAVSASAPAPSLRNTNRARAPEPALAAAAVDPPLDSFGPLAEAPTPKPAPPPPAVPRAPPPPDRWQTMSDDLARCASEGGWSGFICDQRVRLASCDGYWGRVAQCPNPPENPR